MKEGLKSRTQGKCGWAPYVGLKSTSKNSRPFVATIKHPKQMLCTNILLEGILKKNKTYD